MCCIALSSPSTNSGSCSFNAATPATSCFVFLGTLESVKRNLRDLKLQSKKSITNPPKNRTVLNIPLNRDHPCFSAKSWSSVRKCATKDRNRVVYTTGVAMQNFLAYKCPSVDLFGKCWRYCAPTLMRDMDVIAGGRGRLCWELDARVQ